MLANLVKIEEVYIAMSPLMSTCIMMINISNLIKKKNILNRGFQLFGHFFFFFN